MARRRNLQVVLVREDDDVVLTLFTPGSRVAHFLQISPVATRQHSLSKLNNNSVSMEENNQVLVYNDTRTEYHYARERYYRAMVSHPVSLATKYYPEISMVCTPEKRI